MQDLFSKMWGYRELLYVLVGRNLKIRYKGSFLGFFWSLLVPLFMILIYAFFLRVMRFPIDLPLLVTGIIVWQFLAMCLGDSLAAILGNANLVTKAAFPRILLPGSMVIANLVNFLLAGVVLAGYLLVVRADFGAVYLLPLLILTQFALCMGVASLLATANVFFRDTEHILSMVMLAWFFMSPIIYPMDLITGPESGLPMWAQHAYFANPMAGIISGYHMLLLSLPSPGMLRMLLSLAVAWLLFFIGIGVFQRFEGRFGDEL